MSSLIDRLAAEGVRRICSSPANPNVVLDAAASF
jgi:hypothetical protein